MVEAKIRGYLKNLQGIKMISRVADAIYWMSRYLERAENIARFIDVNIKLILDLGLDEFSQQWESLILTSGDEKSFHKHYKRTDEPSVIKFLSFDEKNSNSIISCVRLARENARSVRDSISSEMWEQINRFYLLVQKNSRKRNMGDLQSFFYDVKMANHLFIGIADTTMSHDEAWHFARMGRLIERADKTSRIIDVKYFQLMSSEVEKNTALDVVQWGALLKSVSAFEMYRKKHQSIHHRNIINFLTFNSVFPRSLSYCVRHLLESLELITGPGARSNCKAVSEGRKVYENLKQKDTDDLLKLGLHTFIDEFQKNINRLDNVIYSSFISPKPQYQDQLCLQANSQ